MRKEKKKMKLSCTVCERSLEDETHHCFENDDGSKDFVCLHCEGMYHGRKEKEAWKEYMKND